MLNNYLVAIIVFFIIGYGFIKKVNIYESFIEGAISGLKIVIEIIPAIFAMLLAVNIFIGSNLLTDLFHNFNSEIIPMIFLRPISGNATLSVLTKIYSTYGPDSSIGLLASVIQGATDTTIYVLALYFSSIKIKNSRYALFCGLMADLFGIIAAFVVVKLFF